MTGAKSFFGRPFGSALLGGLVVGLFGWLAIAAGWIHSDNTSDQIAQPLLTQQASSTTGGALTVSQIYQRDSQGVAYITAQKTQKVQAPFNLFPQQQQSTATGSGFVVDTAGHILTNNHVVSGAQKITVKLENGNALDAKLVGADPSSDVALLQVSTDSSSLHPLQLGDSSGVQVGDPVVAIGNPFGLDRTVTSGIVSAKQREISAPNGFSISDVIQTDAAINPGNSGGPLINALGQVVGINSQIETGGGQGSVGIGFAVPSNTANDVVKQLESTGQVKRAFLGIEGASLSPQLSKALNLHVSTGALVQQAYPGSPAARAGIHGGSTQASVGGQQVLLGGDIITAVNGKPIQGMDQVVAAVNNAKPGDQLKLSILRGDKPQDVTVTLGERPAQIKDSSAPTGQ